MSWKATAEIFDTNPTIWLDNNNDGLNDNPWEPIYPWEDGDEIIIEPERWFVDGDSWILDFNSIKNLIEPSDELGISQNEFPNVFMIDSIYPNPFNPTTTIRFSLPHHSLINVHIYDLQGRLVDKLFNGYKQSGFHEIIWNAHEYSSGVYFVKVQSEREYVTSKILLVK